MRGLSLKRLLCMMVGLFFLLMTPSLTEAHAGLERVSPASDETLSSAPQQVDLWFDQSVQVTSNAVRVVDESGSEVQEGVAFIDQEDKKHVVIPMPQALADGAYTVHYEVISEDGHPIDGSFRFFVENTGVTEEVEETESVEESDSAGATDVESNHEEDSGGPTPSQEITPGDQETAPQNDNGNSGLWVTVIVVLLAAGLFFFMRRRR